jgi:hypothetical protein
MDSLWQEHREEEYNMLIQFHKQNLDFRMPLAILGFTAVATQYLLSHPFLVDDQEIENLLGIKLIFLLLASIVLMGIPCLNLIFASHRICDDARMVAYIQLFYEDSVYRDYWLGWETSLRIFRRFKVTPKSEVTPRQSTSKYGFLELFTNLIGYIKDCIIKLPKNVVTVLISISRIKIPGFYDTNHFPELIIGNLVSILIIFLIYFFRIELTAEQFILQQNFFLFSHFPYFFVSFFCIFYFLVFLILLSLPIDISTSIDYIQKIEEERNAWISICKDKSWLAEKRQSN